MKYYERWSLPETRGEADPKGGAKELLDPDVDGPEHPVELVLVHRVVGQPTDEEHGVLLADGEGGTEQAEVPPEEVLVERLVVLLRGRHHVGLVVEGPLP